MRLSHINLSGFKSFVDPTTITFPSNLVGIVGPNGCGKSNVIDAVRWVMGESSAKNLRGGSMTDVIFNGSKTRSNSEYAEVELVFDQAHLSQYPNVEEIAIKRRLTRDNDSQYFLNGVKCRKKDITTLFLGTGLGPRSYAIIEQGMISRFIEAKPEDLRLFLEEAAGISKYKEKRHETELRLQHTKENLTRIEDIKNELEKNVDKLQRQVKAAEKYRDLKENMHILRGQVLALRWKGFEESLQQTEQNIVLFAEELEQNQQYLIDIQEHLTHKRQQQSQQYIEFNEIQAKFYVNQAEIDKLDHQIGHIQQRQEELEWDLEQTESALLANENTLEKDREQLEDIESESYLAENQLEELAMRSEQAQLAFEKSQQTFQTMEISWEVLNKKYAEIQRQIEVEKTQLQNLDRHLQQNYNRLQRLENEAQQVDVEMLEQEIHELNEKLFELEGLLNNQQNILESSQQEIVQQRQENQFITKQIHEKQSFLQQAKGKLASLETLQESVLGKDNPDLSQWLQKMELSQTTPRLVEMLQVEQGWEKALETVLEHALQALCIQNFEDFLNKINELPSGNLTILNTQSQSKSLNNSKSYLLDKIKTTLDLTPLLGHILIAEDLKEAKLLISELKTNESIITKQGLWLGKNWLKINEQENAHAGVFAREQDLQHLKAYIQQLEEEIEELHSKQDNTQRSLLQYEERRNDSQRTIQETQRNLSQLQAGHSGQSARLEQITVRVEQLEIEKQELKERISLDQETVEESKLRLAEGEEQLLNYSEQLEQLKQERAQSRELVEKNRQQWQYSRDVEQQTKARLNVMKTDKIRLQQAIERLETQAEDLTDKKNELLNALSKIQLPDELAEQKQTLDKTQQHLEQQLKNAKTTLEQLEQELTKLDTEQRALEVQVGKNRSALEQAKLNHQNYQVRRQAIEEQLVEEMYDVQIVLTQLPEDANEIIWQAQLDEIEQKLAKLGSVNLAALEEYQTEYQRKTELDIQYNDLNEGVKLLTQAIDSIDQEIRGLLQKTLDTINQGFQAMFPRLFGGGEASLKLITQDILSSGITVMARPPGKKNSTIHLLSGGEKALTAVALVFAIFELNPAPFCLLDEVDAPLDDTNVGRFCKLVKEMSSQLQFIFISHNKIAMEIAEQLIGVTMQEAGVSRPVSVDIDLAVEMATVI